MTILTPHRFGPALRLLLLLLLSLPLHLFAQCPNDNTLQGSAITIPCPGSFSPIPCVRGGRYLLVNVSNTRTYTFATCGSNNYDTFITLRNNTGGAVLAFNDDACGTQSSITWTATFTGQVRVLLDQSVTCNATTNCIAVNISCNTSAPINDLICNATVLPVNTTCINLATSPTNVVATNTAGPPAPGCANYVGGDIWYRLTVPAGGNVTITTKSIGSSAFRDAGMAAYTSSDNTCTGALTLVSCNDDINFPFNTMSSLNLTGLVPGSTLFVRVWEAGNDLFGRFNICAFVTPPLPDNPCQAISVPVGSFCDAQNFTNVGATTTTTPGNPGCGGFGGTPRDVWYSFTAPANGSVVVQTDRGTMTDAVMAIYSSSNGTCSGTLTLVAGACDDDGGAGAMPYLYRTGLTPGVTYWIRIFGFGGSSGTFFMCVFSPTGTRLEDCRGGTTVCDDQHVENSSLFTGFVPDLSATNFGCLASAERQGTWYAFSIGTPGSIGFTISPLALDDYDFAIWGPYPAGSFTGSVCSPGGPPIRCSYASGPNTFTPTGSYNTGMANPLWVTPTYSGPATCGSCTEGSGGNGWISGIDVTAGEVYLMYISNFSQTGSAFDLNWELAAGATLACTLLPVEFLSFQADRMDEMVDVKWATATEQHSDHYVIERSPDGVDFAPIGTIAAAGASQHRIDYRFLDAFPLRGANYYRLRQVDTDGAYEFTSVAVVFMGQETSVPVVFPNPTADLLNVSFTMPIDGTAYFQVIDASGRVVRDRDMDLERGPRTVPVNLNGLSNGPYVLRVITTADRLPQSTRFTKE
jgi:hypothetical protein